MTSNLVSICKPSLKSKFWKGKENSNNNNNKTEKTRKHQKQPVLLSVSRFHLIKESVQVLRKKIDM